MIYKALWRNTNGPKASNTKAKVKVRVKTKGRVVNIMAVKEV